jgi:hypothetical protein
MHSLTNNFSQGFLITLPSKHINYPLRQIQRNAVRTGLRKIRIVRGDYAGQFGKCTFHHHPF